MTKRYRPSACGGGEAGFSLLETVVALAILGIGLTAVFQTFGTGLRGTERVESQAVAMAVAKSALAELGASLPLEPGDQTRRDPTGFQVVLSIAPVLEETLTDGTLAAVSAVERSTLMQVDVRVVRAGREILSLTSLKRRVVP